MPRPTKPAALKLVEGRGHGRDSGGRVVPTPPAFKRLPPAPPEWLSEIGRAEWDRVLPELERLELVKELDGSSLAVYCETFALFVMAREDVQDNGPRVTNYGKDGFEYQVANPSVASMLKAQAAVKAWASEFGLTPAAEMKLAKAEVPTNGSTQGDNPFAAHS